MLDFFDCLLLMLIGFDIAGYPMSIYLWIIVTVGLVIKMIASWYTSE